jgi:hypothetical protein
MFLQKKHCTLICLWDRGEGLFNLVFKKLLHWSGNITREVLGVDIGARSLVEILPVTRIKSD